MSKRPTKPIKILFKTNTILPTILFLGLVTFFYLDLGSFFNWNYIRLNYSVISQISVDNFFYSAIAFFFVYLFATAFSFPVLTVLSILGGALFGWTAVPLILISGTLGCWVVFKASKGFLYDYFSQRTNPYILSITSSFNKGPFTWLLTLKLFPFLPVSFGNIIPGIFGMKSSIFLLAAFLGFSPGSLIYVAFGIGIAQLIESDKTLSLSMLDNPNIYIPLAGLFLISTTSFVVKFLKMKKENS